MSRLLKRPSAMGLTGASGVMFRGIPSNSLKLETQLRSVRRPQTSNGRLSHRIRTSTSSNNIDDDSSDSRSPHMEKRRSFSLSPQAKRDLPSIFSPRPKTSLGRMYTSKGSSTYNNNNREEKSRLSSYDMPQLSPRSEKRVVVVQAQVRRRKSINQLPLARHAYYRGAQRRNKRKMKRILSATRIQTIFRGHYTFINRHRIVELRERRRACVQMQRVTRGFLARQGAVVAEKQLSSALWCQSRYRGQRGRTRFRAIKAEHDRVQEELRLYEEEQERLRKEAELEAYRRQKEAERAAALEAARLRKEEEERLRKERELKEFKRKQAAEREARRKAEEAAAAEKRRLEEEAAAKAAALAAEKARLAKLAFEVRWLDF